MRAIVIIRGMLLSLGLLATVGVTACATNQAPSSAGPDNRQTGTPAASSTATKTASPPAGTPTSGPARPGGVRNLVISSAERRELTAAFVAYKGISPSDLFGVGPLPGSVYYAHDLVTDTYWALASFQPSSTASLNVKVNFQDGGNVGMFRKSGGGRWQAQTPGWPPICAEVQFFPPTVLMTWSLPTSAPPGASGC